MTTYEIYQLEKYGNILPEPEIEDQENNEISQRQISIEIIELENL